MKRSMRKMLTKDDIAHNAACFKKQMEKFIDFSEGKALMLNNADWLLDLNYVELLREVGACFSVNNMLRAECYKQRMEKGLSFLEFNYMIMQSYETVTSPRCVLKTMPRMPTISPMSHFARPVVSHYIHNDWAEASALLLLTLAICILFTPILLKIIPQLVAQKDLLKVK